MINCPKCKAEIDTDSHFCDQCGQEIFYCSRCGRPGKGQRCTTCGGVMRRLSENEKSTDISTNDGATITSRESMMAAAIGATFRSGIPQLFLVNDSLHMRLAGTNGAIIGRRAGIYQQFLAQYNYISGTHAQLNYNQQQGWIIEDKNSSNGTFVNSRRLTPGQSMPIHQGDLVQLANIEFRVEISSR